MRLYRFASPAPLAWTLLKAVVSTSLVWGVFLVAIPWAISQARGVIGLEFLFFPPQRLLGMLGFGLTGMVAAWATLTVAVVGRGTPLSFDAPRRLVTVGPYAWMRNPLLMSGVGFGIAAAVYTGALLAALYAVLAGVGWQLLIRSGENRELERAFGREYEAYRRHVRYWLPMRKPWVSPRDAVGPITLDEVPLTPGRRRRAR